MLLHPHSSLISYNPTTAIIIFNLIHAHNSILSSAAASLNYVLRRFPYILESLSS